MLIADVSYWSVTSFGHIKICYESVTSEKRKKFSHLETLESVESACALDQAPYYIGPPTIQLQGYCPLSQNVFLRGLKFGKSEKTLFRMYSKSSIYMVKHHETGVYILNSSFSCTVKASVWAELRNMRVFSVCILCDNDSKIPGKWSVREVRTTIRISKRRVLAN